MTYDEIRTAWNAQADEHNQWDALGEDEKVEWAAKHGAAKERTVRLAAMLALPLASKEESDLGWILDYHFLDQVEKLARQRTDYTTSMEAAEQVLIAAAEILAAALTT